MREIKFIGQCKSYDKVVIGSLDVNGDKYYIKEINEDGKSQRYRVIPDTIGEFTGQKDKNGEEIFEGDKVIVDKYEEEGLFTVEWDIDTCRFKLSSEDLCVDFDNVWGHECELAYEVDDEDIPF